MINLWLTIVHGIVAMPSRSIYKRTTLTFPITLLPSIRYSTRPSNLEWTRENLLCQKVRSLLSNSISVLHVKNHCDLVGYLGHLVSPHDHSITYHCSNYVVAVASFFSQFNFRIFQQILMLTSTQVLPAL